MTPITVLTTLGPLLAKQWLSNGTISDYDLAKRYKWETYEIAGLAALHRLIAMLAEQPRRCIIRGQPMAGLADMCERNLENFCDAPSRLLMIDVDHFEPVSTDPAEMCAEFVATLPTAFRDISYIWQLSGSCGHPTRTGLRAHLWFWLDEPVTCELLEQWAKATLPGTDCTVHRPVQINYSADPIIEAGADPYAGRRIGFCQGLIGDEVDVDIASFEPDASQVATTKRAGRRGLNDPRNKRGIVGEVCRAFKPLDLIRLFPEHFAAGEARDKSRFTWLKGGGAKEGLRVGDSGLHILNSHGTSPIGNRAVNIFDLIRTHVYGHLDSTIHPDALALDPGAAPSYVATAAWAKGALAVQNPPATPEAANVAGVADSSEISGFIEISEVIETPDDAPDRQRKFNRMLTSITAAPDIHTLETVTAPRLAAAEMSDGERNTLAVAVQARSRDLCGGHGLPIRTVRQWLAPTGGHNSPFPDITADGEPKLTVANVAVVMARMGVKPKYNVIAKKIEFVHTHDVVFSIENANNNARTMIVSECSRLGMRPSKDLINCYIDLIAAENEYNPALEWIESRAWDGVPRINALADTIVTQADFPVERKRVMVRKWMIQCAALAATDRPITARGVLIVQGKQYIGKSRWLKSLVPGQEHLAALGVTLDASNRDSKKSATRAWLVELGELDATFNKSDIAALKAFVAQDMDERRDAYARDHAEFMRRTSFYGSVNDDIFLHDQTGNTRFWALPAVAMNHEHGLDMQQAWAEALNLWRSGEPHWLSDAEMGDIEKSTDGFSSKSLMEERVYHRFFWDKWRAGDPDIELRWMSSLDVLKCLDMGLRATDGDSVKVGKAVRKLSGLPSKMMGGLRKLAVPCRKGESIGELRVPDFDDAGAGSCNLVRSPVAETLEIDEKSVDGQSVKCSGEPTTHVAEACFE